MIATAQHRNIIEEEKRATNRWREKVEHYEPQRWIFEMFQGLGFVHIKSGVGEWYIEKGNEYRVSSIYILSSPRLEGKIVYLQYKCDHGHGSVHGSFHLKHIPITEFVVFLRENHVKRLSKLTTLKRFLAPQAHS